MTLLQKRKNKRQQKTENKDKIVEPYIRQNVVKCTLNAWHNGLAINTKLFQEKEIGKFKKLCLKTCTIFTTRTKIT